MLGSDDNNHNHNNDNDRSFRRRPLTIDECWSRAYDWVFRRHALLFGKVALGAILPMAFFLVWCFHVYYDWFDPSVAWKLEAWMLSLSIVLANGPIMVATARLCAGGSREGGTHRDNDIDDSWWWHECYAVFFRPTISSNGAIHDHLGLLGKTIAGGLVAVAIIYLLAFYLWLPGHCLAIYFSIRWYFLPCILLFDQVSVPESFRRSYKATSSSPSPLQQQQQQRAGSAGLLADRRKGVFGIKLEIFSILFRLFLLEIVGTLLVLLCSVLLSAILDRLGVYDGVANTWGMAVFVVGSIAHKSLLVPFSIVLKTTLYLNLRVIAANNNIEDNDHHRHHPKGGDDEPFRSLLRDSGLCLDVAAGSSSWSGGGSDDDGGLKVDLVSIGRNEPEETQRSLLAANEALELRERNTSSSSVI